MTATEAYLALNLLPNIGPVRVRRLLEAFGSPEQILRTSADQLRRIEGIGTEIAAAVEQWESVTDVAGELTRIREAGVKLVSLAEATYPQSLRQIPDPPLVLYYRGDLRPQDDRGIAVVGSRRATRYGLDCSKRLSFQLAQNGVTVLSGLARGIDTAAHEGAIAGGGRTIAVIGSGLNNLYPPENDVLAQKIADGHGAVVSEFPLNTNPNPTNFPLRNRIVAGWSQGTLVVEAPARSGALITVKQASDYGRAIYAVPGPIDRPSSQGCHHLIQHGAKLVMHVSDIVTDLEWLIPPAAAPEEAPVPGGLTAEEATVWEAMGLDEMTLDGLIEAAELPTASVKVALMKLEIKKLIRALPGRRYVRVSQWGI
jgi:DNA processing protein